MASGWPTLADDSGLVVADLGGAPGVYTADWAEGEKGRDFGVAMARTWELLDAVRAPAHRSAHFCCVLVLAWPDGGEQVFEGTLPGRIVWPMRGRFGHGYDPIFLPDDHKLTMGEMEPALKNLISHRAQAVGEFIAVCFT
jgi:XTP/dITP diphosphohydrolase